MRGEKGYFTVHFKVHLNEHLLARAPGAKIVKSDDVRVSQGDVLNGLAFGVVQFPIHEHLKGDHPDAPGAPGDIGGDGGNRTSTA